MTRPVHSRKSDARPLRLTFFGMAALAVFAFVLMHTNVADGLASRLLPTATGMIPGAEVSVSPTATPAPAVSRTTATASPAATQTAQDKAGGFIDLSVPFTYPVCMQDMKSIAEAYPDRARVETIGTTMMGNPINAIVLGSPKAKTKVLFQAAIHAKENITALVALRQVESLLLDASHGAVFQGMTDAEILAKLEVWVVPMSNPDGIRLATEGLSAVPSTMPALTAKLLQMNNGSMDFFRWKSNANGVDLNRNFDAKWKVDPDYQTPGIWNYSGPKPFSEPETIALRDLTIAKDFAMTMSYHTSGKAIYWYDAGLKDNTVNLALANQIRALTGYALVAVSDQDYNGGYKDWYNSKYHRPSLTLEIGEGYSPLPQSNFKVYWQETQNVMLSVLWTAAQRYCNVEN